jgi:hypothetical protein
MSIKGSWKIFVVVYDLIPFKGFISLRTFENVDFQRKMQTEIAITMKIGAISSKSLVLTKPHYLE